MPKNLRYLLIVFFVCALPAFSQTSTAELSGIVLDPSKAVVAGAIVSIVDPATNRTHETQTNELGFYQFSFLAPATYRLEVEKTGFKKLVRGEIGLHVNQQARLDVVLELGALGETVTVTAEAPLLDATSASLGAVVSGQQVADLPVIDRQVFQLAFLTPGVVPAEGSTIDDPAQFNNAVNFSSQGAQRQSAQVLVDGLDVSMNVNTPSFQGVASVPSMDSVQEIKVQANSFSAEFGRAGGGVLNAVLKSGTNELHGTLFEFLRNNVLDANTFFANRAGNELKSFKRNQFGGNLGGPIYIPGIYDGRNRTFFFFGYEGLRQGTPSETTARVPTALERAGDFSQTFNNSRALTRVFDPFTTVRQPDGSYVRQPFPGNIVPIDRFDPVALKVLSFYPLSNTTGIGASAQGNFFSSKSAVFNRDRYDLKIDEYISPTDHLIMKYSRAHSNSLDPSRVDNPAGGGTTQPITTHNATVNYTRNFSSATVADMSVGFSRLYNTRSALFEPFDVTTIGLPARINASANHRIFPNFTVSGLMGLGNNSDRPLLNVGEMFSTRASVVKTTGRHSLNVGFAWQLRRVNHSQGGSTGTFNFDAGFTQGPDPLRANNTAGYGFASFLLGTPSSGSFGTVPFVSTQNHYFGGYLQDDFRATRKLTLNLGLRYEVELPRTERYNRQNYLDLGGVNPLAEKVGLPLRGGLRFAGVDGNPRTPYNADANNLSPRIGFAYQLVRNTVLRGGYGIFYSIPPVGAAGLAGGNLTGFSVNTAMLVSADGVTPHDRLRNPFPNGFVPPRGSQDGMLTQVGQSIGSVLRDASTPYMEQWNLNIQRQLRGGFLVEAAYGGSRGINLQVATLNYNQLPDTALSMRNTLNDMVPNPFFGYVDQGTLSLRQVQRKQLLRPYPEFTGVSVSKHTVGQSTYHSLQLRVQRRFSSGFSLLLAYTNAKLLTDSDAAENFLGPLAQYQNYNNFHLERSLSAMDVSQRLVISYTYEFPFGKGKKWGSGSNSVVDAVLGGWQLNGIASLQTGMPINVRTQTDTSQSIGQGTQRPNSTGRSATLPGDRSTTDKLLHWFDTSQFTQPDPFSFGNVSRTLPDVRMDAMHSLDASAFKNFKFREKGSVQFRAEAYNAFNTPRFGAPNMQFGAPAFGSINTGGQRNTPRKVQFGLKIRF